MQRRLAFGSLLLVASSSLLVACGGDDATKPGGSQGTTSGTTTGGDGGQGGQLGSGGSNAGGADDPLTPGADEMLTISGDLTWQATFDATAKAGGATDCSYTRHYEGTQDMSAPWECPLCEVIYKADVVMTAGQADCFSQVSPDDPAKIEWIGYGKGVWYRGVAFTSDQGTASIDGADIAIANQVKDQDLTAPSTGKVTFDITGAMKLAVVKGDKLHGFVPPATYACGWPKADPPAYAGDYTVVKGATVPDGVFKDKCDEPVRLHDFKGSYLLVDMAARDCPPCQQMASEEEAFVTNMKGQGIDVHVVTLLAPSLANPLGDTTTTMLNSWVTKYGLTSPVLADRSWGVAMFVPLYPDTLGYPSWVLVDKDLKVMKWGNGYGGFAEMEAAIVADAN